MNWGRHTIAFACLNSILLHAEGDGGIENSVMQADGYAAEESPNGSWAAIPIPMSNPTLGNGLQGVLLYMHPSASPEESTNSTSGIATMYTDNGSRGVGAFHDGISADGLHRYRFYGGSGDLNLSYYGVGANSIFANNPIDYSISAWAFGGQFLRKVPSSENWYAGLTCLHVDANLGFEGFGQLQGLPNFSRPFRNSSLGLLATYDDRDDNYYPRSGQLFELSIADYGHRWGGDYDYAKTRVEYSKYLPLTEQTVLAFNTDLQTSGGNTPFFDLPNLNMRGFSQDRYRDENSLSLHLELRYKFLPRWGAVVFTEAGWTGAELSDLLQADPVNSYGAGLRWQVSEEKSLNLGIDYAFGESENALYIRIGEMF